MKSIIWITVSDATKLTNYHPETIRELVRDGKIEGRKISIVWQVNRESLLAYVENVGKLGKKRGRKPATTK